MRNTKAILLLLVVEANDDGYLARYPSIQGAFAEEDTIEEAIFNCADVIKMIAACPAEGGENLGFDVELISDTVYLRNLCEYSVARDGVSQGHAPSLPNLER